MSSTSPYLMACAARAASRFDAPTDVSILLRHHGANIRAASTSEASARCDQVEARTDEGPCIAASKSLGAVLVPEIAAEERWPTWRAHAEQEGYAASLAMPAVVAPDVRVSIDLYSRSKDPWDTAALVTADACAQEVARAVGMRLQLTAAVARARPDRSPTSRDIVDEAVALTVAANACTPDEARLVLEEAAERRKVRLAAIAETLVLALSPGADEPP